MSGVDVAAAVHVGEGPGDLLENLGGLVEGAGLLAVLGDAVDKLHDQEEARGFLDQVGLLLDEADDLLGSRVLRARWRSCTRSRLVEEALVLGVALSRRA